MRLPQVPLAFQCVYGRSDERDEIRNREDGSEIHDERK